MGRGRSVDFRTCAGSAHDVGMRKGGGHVITLKGTVGATGKHLLCDALPNNLSGLLKFTLETTTAGANLCLMSGSMADFGAGNGKILISSGGPGYQHLTLLNPADLGGKALYIKLVAGSGTPSFTLQFE